jgi:hypothetical protein
MVLGLSSFALACIAIGLSRTLLQAILARCICESATMLVTVRNQANVQLAFSVPSQSSFGPFNLRLPIQTMLEKYLNG